MAAFQIDLEGTDGKREVLIYETDPASLKRLDGSAVDLSAINKLHVENHWKERPAFSPTNPIGKTSNVKRLKIQLGLACNYSCSYCSQGNQIAKASITDLIDTQAFLDGMDKWLEGEPSNIELWGGEPLVYWKKILLLAPVLRARFPNAKILIITNGTLLDAEMIEFFVQHEITVAVSHDGPGQSLRGDDPFSNPDQADAIRMLFDYLGMNASFNCVMTAENTDMKAIINFFTSKMGRQVVVNIEDPVTAYDGMTSFGFSHEQHKRMAENVTKRIADGTALDVPSVLMKLEAFFNGIAGGIRQNQCGQWCGMDGKDFLTVDLLGNVLTCQNTGAKDHKIGHVDSFDDIKLDTSYHFSERKHCAGCPVVHLCYGSCMFLTGTAFDVSCDNSYYYNLAAIFGALEILTGKKVTGIDYKKPLRPFPVMVVSA